MQLYQSNVPLTFHAVIAKIILPPIYGSKNQRNKGEMYTNFQLQTYVENSAGFDTFILESIAKIYYCVK